jgi:hypothetical protein
MTNKQFTKLIARTAKAYNRYLPLLKKAEDEYERRFGHNPSDADDDFWIDSLQGGCGAASAITAEDVEESALTRKTR